MILAARVAKLDTEKQLTDLRQVIVERDATIIRSQEELDAAKGNLINAEERCENLSSTLQGLENEVASYSGMKKQLEDSTENVELLQTQMVRQGKEIVALGDDKEALIQERDEANRKCDGWQKQVQQLQEQLAEAAKYMPAPGEGPRPTTPRPDWSAMSGEAVSEDMREALRKGSSVQNATVVYEEMERLHQELEGDTIPCMGDGDDVPAHLSWVAPNATEGAPTGTVKRQTATLPETRARVADLWMLRMRKRAQDLGRKKDSEPFCEFVRDYFRDRCADKHVAAQAAYNLHIDADRHGGPPGGRLSEAICYLTARVMHDDWSEGVFLELHSMLCAFARVLGGMCGKDGSVAKRDVNALLEDFFPSQPEHVLHEARNALTKDCPGSTLEPLLLLDGGASPCLARLCMRHAHA